MSLIRRMIVPFVIPVITNKTQTYQSILFYNFISNRTYADIHGKKGNFTKYDATNNALSKVDWRKRLSSEEYHVTREKGTEPPFSGKYCNHHDKGVYICTCCSTELFSSSQKYDSHSGWPSFYDVISTKDKEGPVKTKLDNSCGMVRTEALCRKCDAHLGHVFEDGPKPTGLRYCINSIALKFISKK